MAATFHIPAYIEPIVNCNNYVWLANGLVQINFVNIDATMICILYNAIKSIIIITTKYSQR